MSTLNCPSAFPRTAVRGLLAQRNGDVSILDVVRYVGTAVLIAGSTQLKVLEFYDLYFSIESASLELNWLRRVCRCSLHNPRNRSVSYLPTIDNQIKYLVFLHKRTRQIATTSLPLPMGRHNSLCYNFGLSSLRLHLSKVGKLEQCFGDADE